MLGNLPSVLSAQEQARYEQASAYDYGQEGDQRPYQIVFPAYKAPKFMQTFNTLERALRECSTLCRDTGLPFRLVKWGGRIPCVPCGRRIQDNRLPGYKVVYSKGALDGYPDAMPVADFKPSGERIVYGPDGEGKLVGEPNYIISAKPYPVVGKFEPGPVPLRYLDAVQSAQYLVRQTGRTAYLCSSMGSDCKRDPKKWFPVVYVEPGGLVARYPYEQDLGPGSISNSTNVVTDVTPSEYEQLVAESQGASYLDDGE